MLNFRVGNGFDVHKLTAGRRLVLGGVEIPSEKGLLGHSDADVILHALSDALIGALALGDIGKFFPDTDARYKDADSKVLLAAVMELVSERGWKVGNVDMMLLLEKPRIAKYVPQMKATIAAILGVEEDAVSVKATSTEQLGFVGREEGAACYATALLYRN